MKRSRLLLLSVLSGLLAAAAWPAHGFTPLIFVAFVPLLALQQVLGDTHKKGMFWYSWLAFFIWNALTTWWIWNSTASGAVAAIAFNSLFMATVFQVYHLSKIKLFDNKRGFGILIFYWISWEYFHTNWQLSWPWLTLGNVFASKHTWIQWYEYTGVFGGTLWVLLANILLYRSLLFYRRRKKKMAYSTGIAFVLLLAVPLIYSQIRYSTYHEKRHPVQVVVVQPNIDPYNEEYSLPPSVVIERVLRLANQKITDSTLYVVCPESTIQEGIWEETLQHSPSVLAIKKFIAVHPKVSFVIGASTFRWLKKDEPLSNAARRYRKDEYYYAFNTAFEIDSTPFVQIHHKSKLTPGVERMPSWVILKPLEKYAIDLGGIVGTLKDEDHSTVFENAGTGLNVSPIICYESVYGEFTARTVALGANLIFVITNDGWWGNTPGYKQHFLFSVLRAIETRRSVARSANTGTSAFINQRGDVSKATPYWKQAVIRETLNANDKITYYVKNGDYLARISNFISFFVLLVAMVRGILIKKKSMF